MYCDLLLARFGLIQQMKFVYSMLDSDSALAICRDIDGGIEEAVNSILWAAPRLVTDVQEFKVISDNLTLKYGKPFAEACRANQFDKVNPKLMAKLGVAAPPKILVEKFSLAVYRFELCLQTRYMIEIAKSCNVPFTPDMNIMREDEVAQAEAMLIDFQQQGQPNSFGWMYPNPHTAPPPGDVPPPYTGNRGNGGGGGGGGQIIAAPQQPQAPPPVTRAFDYPNLKQQVRMCVLHVFTDWPCSGCAIVVERQSTTAPRRHDQSTNYRCV
jgi:vacuolar protein sorting-associated protein IST1